MGLHCSEASTTGRLWREQQIAWDAKKIFKGLKAGEILHVILLCISHCDKNVLHHFFLIACTYFKAALLCFYKLNMHGKKKKGQPSNACSLLK